MAKNLPMTADEICTSYRESKFPKGQVKILAQLNACSVGDILDVLTDHGYTVPEDYADNRRKKGTHEKNKPELQPFADRLRLLIESNEKTQKQIADGVGCTPSAISNYIGARYMPDAPILERLAVVLGTTPEYLYGDGWDEYKQQRHRGRNPASVSEKKAWTVKEHTKKQTAEKVQKNAKDDAFDESVANACNFIRAIGDEAMRHRIELDRLTDALGDIQHEATAALQKLQENGGQKNG